MKEMIYFLPPAARGGSFCKNRPPWTPPKKLLISGGFAHHLSSVICLLSSVLCLHNFVAKIF
jgi:hypothetical protein